MIRCIHEEHKKRKEDNQNEFFKVIEMVKETETNSKFQLLKRAVEMIERKSRDCSKGNQIDDLFRGDDIFTIMASDANAVDAWASEESQKAKKELSDMIEAFMLFILLHRGIQMVQQGGIPKTP